MGETRYHGWQYVRWAWRSTGTIPFVGVCWFQGIVIFGLWPLTIELGAPRMVRWDVRRDQ